MPLQPEDLPEALRNITPNPCKWCGSNIWYSKADNLIMHEPPNCEGFNNTMTAMRAIAMKAKKGGNKA